MWYRRPADADLRLHLREGGERMTMEGVAPILELRAVTRRFAAGGAGGDPAGSPTGPTAGGVGPVDLVLPPGTTVALVGPSGCGKSTLLRLVVGLLAPDSGIIRVSGEPLTAATAPRLRRAMGYVIQEGALFPHLTARDNVALLPRDLGWEEARIASRIAELAELARLPAPLLARLPAELSGGQRQRVALMRALVLDPPLLLLDEPLGALDPVIRVQLQGELARLFRTLGKAALFVTHDLGEAARVADRIALLAEGHIVQEGRAAELAARPADPFVAEFVAAARAAGWPEDAS
jgi:osmoprotectant transport system ATP-binding protein